MEQIKSYGLFDVAVHLVIVLYIYGLQQMITYETKCLALIIFILPVDELSLAYKVQDFVRMVSVPKLLQSYGERYAILFSHTAVRQ